MNTWTERTCCSKTETMPIRLSYFDAGTEKIDIFFCDSIKSTTRILLSKKERGLDIYKTLIDIQSISPVLGKAISLEKDIPSKFEAEVWSPIRLEDGKYRIFIGTGSSCGEIQFSIKNGIRSDMKLICLVDNC